MWGSEERFDAAFDRRACVAGGRGSSRVLFLLCLHFTIKNDWFDRKLLHKGSQVVQLVLLSRTENFARGRTITRDGRWKGKARVAEVVASWKCGQKMVCLRHFGRHLTRQPSLIHLHFPKPQTLASGQSPTTPKLLLIKSCAFAVTRNQRSQFHVGSLMSMVQCLASEVMSATNRW